MNITIPTTFTGETPEDQELIEKVEDFLFRFKKDTLKYPFFINDIPYEIICGNPPNTNVFHIMNEDQLKEWNDPNVYLRPYAKPKGVWSFFFLNIKNKKMRSATAWDLCRQWNVAVRSSEKEIS